MANVEQQIAESRASKKAALKKGALGLLGVMILGGLGAVTYQFMPDVTVSEHAAGKTASQPSTPPETESVERATLQQALTAAKQTLYDSLDEDLIAWAPARVKALTQRLDDAYSEYGMGEYARANASLQHIQDALSALLQDYRLAYETPHEQAHQAFQNNAMPTAARLNHQALTVNPDFAPALALQQRIAVFEDVQAMYEQARVGKVENNLKKQQQAYTRIIELDPQREDAEAELARINAALQEKNFNQTLQHAVAAVDAGRLEDGQAYLDKASAIRQTGPQLVALQARINKAVKQQGADAAEQKITMFSRLQEWKTVKLLAQDGIAAHPNNPVIRHALDTANKVLAAEARLDRYLDAPSRLADNNIRQRALEAVTEVSALRKTSTQLGEKVEQLKQLIEEENIPLNVTVISDGQSYLKVLGVGHIGEVESKTIQLKPGKYKMEASRQGYRTKLQDIVVQKSVMPIVVRLACTDAI